jgi:hypothetical protein
MKSIKLTQGQITFVDDEDYEKFNKYKWYAQKSLNTYYAVRRGNINGHIIQIRMHREILNCAKELKIDHVDRNGLNNCKSNLRICTHEENMWNLNNSKNKSGIIGVSFSPDRNKWVAQIKHHNKTIGLGRFNTKEEAEIIYLAKKKELRGYYLQ